MKAVVFAYHNIGIVGLEAIKKIGFAIQAIFSHDDDPEENCWFGSVKDWAMNNSIEVFCPLNINEPRWVNKIADLAPDVIFSFYYRYMLDEDILNIPASGAYNLHGSLLPAYRGRCPVNWVLINGETQTGVTLHHMTKKADAGDIVCQRAVTIDFEDTALTLHEKLCRETAVLLEEILPLIEAGDAPRTPQDLKAGSYFGGRRPEDGKIDWEWPAVRIYNLIRAVTFPYPGAFSFLPDGQKILIWQARPLLDDDMRNCVPGGVVIMRRSVCIEAARGGIELVEIEIAGRRMRDAEISHFFEGMKGIVLR
jgi:methionyl-tRNA formyltransferase